MSFPKVTDEGCDGRCTSCADLGVPELGGDKIAYPDPECTVHGPMTGDDGLVKREFHA